MNRRPVTSSNIASIGYDENARILEIEFKSGAVYQYLDVPQEVYVELMGSESHGKYLAARVKGNYEFSRVH